MGEYPVTKFGWDVGCVVARAMRAVGDQTPEIDTYPDAVPLSGGVVFTPATRDYVVRGDVSTRVIAEPVIAQFDDQGYLSIAESRGVWLWAGAWTVDAHSVGVEPFTIEVSKSHTLDHPLDLWSIAPIPEPAHVTKYVLEVPSDFQEGKVLSSDGKGGLVWVDQKSSGASVDFSEYAKKTDIPDVSGFAVKGDIPDLRPYLRKSEISSILASYLTRDEAQRSESRIVQSVLAQFANVANQGA